MNYKAVFEEIKLKVKDSIRDCEDLIVRNEWEEASRKTNSLEMFSDTLRTLAKDAKVQDPETCEEMKDYAVWIDHRIISFLYNCVHKYSCYYYQTKD